MELQPVLHGPRLYLRPLKAADFDALFAAASDPLIWEQHPASNRHERKIFEQFFDRALKSRGALAILDKTTQKIIGTSRYYDVEGTDSVCIGFTFLTRDYWGGTYGHVHSGHGRVERDGTTFINASVMNESYKPEWKPYVFDLD
jgi:RimJ/RimL family protein N-acetyltransferase